ncbi:MAG: oxidoreductase-like domain-containing protein [Acidiferrobacterales bacterium]|nr:oxidoreductase-like domain-containing protein [Acidiferrobacterales bacterium]
MKETTKKQVESPPPPTKPDPNECCGSGCSPCVFDYYQIALDKWNAEYGGVDNDRHSEV